MFRNRHFAAAAALVAGLSACMHGEAKGQAHRADPASPQLIPDSEGIAGMASSLAFSPEGKLLAAAGTDKAVRVWETGTGRLRACLRGYREIGFSGICSAVAFSPDGKTLVVGVQDSTPNNEGALRAYPVASLGEPEPPMVLLPAHGDDGVEKVVFSADGRWMATEGTDRTVFLWDWPGRKIVAKLPIRSKLIDLLFVDGISVLFGSSPAGLYFWSVPSGRAINPAESGSYLAQANVYPTTKKLQALQDNFRAIQPPPGGQISLSRILFGANSNLLAGSSSGPQGAPNWVGIWGSDRQRRSYMNRHRGKVMAAAVSPDGSLVASGDALGIVEVWRASDGKAVAYSPLRAKSDPLYSVAWDETGRYLLFGKRPPSGDPITTPAPFDRAFDLKARRIIPPPPGKVFLEKQTQGDDALRVTYEQGRGETLEFLRGGRVAGRVPLELGARTRSLTFLRDPKLAGPGLFVIGGTGGGLGAVDPETLLGRRDFAGHTASVEAMSQSPDNRFLASACLDGVIRIFSLEGPAPLPNVDFGSDIARKVTYLVPGGSAERAGVRIGDQVVLFDGMDPGAAADRWLRRDWPYRVDQVVPVVVERDGRRLTFQLALEKGGDYAEPLYSLYIAGESEWVLYTPEGYYDASLNGDGLIGWHLNQGRDRSGRFFEARQFKERFFRPDVIDELIRTGSLPEAIASANQDERGGQPVIADLRDPDTFRANEPPRVRISRPTPGTVPKVPRIRLVGHVTPVKDAPAVRELEVLVDNQLRIQRPLNLGDQQAQGGFEVQEDLEVASNEDHRITLRVRNDASAYDEASVDIRGPSTTTPGRLFVLSIGISEYQNPTIRQLLYAHRDAESFLRAWEPQTNHGLYRRLEPKLITNRDATTSRIREELEGLAAEVRADDTAIIFVAGHGTVRERDNAFFLAGHDSDVDQRKLTSTALRLSEVAEAISQIRGRRVILFLDTCHSGFADSVFTPLRRELKDAHDRGLVLYSACQAHEQSLEDPKDTQDGHGLFTRALLEAFSGSDPARVDLNRDQILSTGELMNFVSVRVPELSRDAQHPLRYELDRLANLPLFRFAPLPANR